MPIDPRFLAEIELNPKPRHVTVVQLTRGGGRTSRRSIHLRAGEERVGVDIALAHTTDRVRELIVELEECIPFMEGKL